MVTDNSKIKVYIAGHRGMVGSAVKRELERNGYENLVLRTKDELDLVNQEAVSDFFSREKPDVVVVAAAKVGGILANDTYRAEFIYENIMIQSNIIHSAYVNGCSKLIFLGSSCIYPKLAPQPLKEEYLLSGFLEPTNEPYAIAKIAGIKLCENYYRQYGSNFYSAMPTNLYGPFDNFDLKTSHVLPALIRKFHEAKRNGSDSVTLWGSGSPLREFLYVDDLAEAVRFLIESVEAGDVYGKGITHINVGTGKDLSIAELAELVAEVTGFTGGVVYDRTKPDGTPRKLMDVSRINELGWRYSTELREGVERTYGWFLSEFGGDGGFSS